MFNSPSRSGFTKTPKVPIDIGKEKMSAPNNAYYVLTQAHAGLPNAQIFNTLGDARYLMLDQSTPQTISNGGPTFAGGLTVNDDQRIFFGTGADWEIKYVSESDYLLIQRLKGSGYLKITNDVVIDLDIKLNNNSALQFLSYGTSNYYDVLSVDASDDILLGSSDLDVLKISWRDTPNGIVCENTGVTLDLSGNLAAASAVFDVRKASSGNLFEVSRYQNNDPSDILGGFVVYHSAGGGDADITYMKLLGTHDWFKITDDSENSFIDIDIDTHDTYFHGDIQIQNEGTDTETVVYAKGNNQAASFVCEDTRNAGKALSLNAGSVASNFTFDSDNGGTFYIMHDTHANTISDPGSGTVVVQVGTNYFDVVGTNSNLRLNAVQGAVGEISAGCLITAWGTNEALNLVADGRGGTAGAKVAGIAYNGSAWRSIWEFANVSSGEPFLILSRSVGGTVVGDTSLTSGAKFDVNGVTFLRDKLAFTQTDFNEYIDSLADGYMDYGATTAHRFNSPIRSSTASYRRYYHLPLASFDPGASGATWTSAGANNLCGWQLNAAGEILEFQTDVHSDWDGESDMTVEVKFQLLAAGNPGDTVDLKLIAYYMGEGDTATKTQTQEEAVTTDGTQYKMYKATFTLNYDETDNNIDAGDSICFVLNLETDTSEIDDVLIVGGTFFYNTTHTGIESTDT